MKNVKYRRSRYFLPNTRQPALLIGAQIILAVLVLLAGVVLFFFANHDLTRSYWAAHLAIKNIQQILLPAIILTDLLGLILGAVALLFFTHRIAGPAYRLGVALREISKGNLNQKVVFRKADYLKELATDTDQMLDALHSRIGIMHQQMTIVETDWIQVHQSALSSEVWKDTGEAIHKLKQCLSEFNDYGGIR